MLFDYPRYEGSSCYGEWYYGDEEWIDDVDWEDVDGRENMPVPPSGIGAGGAASSGTDDGDGAGAGDAL